VVISLLFGGYLLRNVTIDRPISAQAMGMTYIPMRRGFV